jgi:hypothetical protein
LGDIQYPLAHRLDGNLSFETTFPSQLTHPADIECLLVLHHDSENRLYTMLFS